MTRIKRTPQEQERISTGSFVDAVSCEMRCQDRHWGLAVDASWNWAEWALIFDREVGEALKEFGTAHWDEDREALLRLRIELIQAAAVAAQITYVIDKRLRQLK